MLPRLFFWRAEVTGQTTTLIPREMTESTVTVEESLPRTEAPGATHLQGHVSGHFNKVLGLSVGQHKTEILPELQS